MSATWPLAPADRRTRSRQTWAVAVLLFAALAATAWMRPLMLPDEGRYVGIAWEMLHGGDWLTPRLDGLPFFHKPPLFYWITAGAMSLLGPHEAAARMASLLGAWGGGMALFLFLRRWAAPGTARLALAVLVVQPLFFVGAQFANLDMLVAGCISATVLCAAHALLCLEQGLPHRTALRGAYALAALGVLAKGLIGGVLPLLVLLAWLLLRRRWRLLPRLASASGLLVFVAIAAPWFVAMQARYPDFLHYFFVVQHFQRYAAAGFNNVQPLWFYPAVLLLCSLPWLPMLAALRRQRGPADGTPPAVTALMASWAAVVVLFFSLPASKLVGYVLPAVPPLAALAAQGLQRLLRARPERARWGWAAGAVSACVGLGLVVGLALRPPHSARELARTLAARQAPGEPVVALAPYPYDLPFYARLRAPVAVVSDWAETGPHSRDDWRKEMADAGRFEPARAQSVLVAPAALPAWLCRAPVAWVITPRGAAAPAFAAAAQAVFSDRDAVLWRLQPQHPASGLACPAAPQTPSGGWPGR